MELDNRKSESHISASSSANHKNSKKCDFCGRLGHVQENCFKKNQPENGLKLNSSIYSVKETNVYPKNGTDDFRVCNLLLSDKISIKALMDSGSDSNFLKFEDFLKLLESRVPLKVSVSDQTFYDARGRVLCHCSYAVEMKLALQLEELGTQNFLIPDEKD